MNNENLLEADRPSSIEIIIQNIVEAFAHLKSISGEYSESVEGRSPEKQIWDNIKIAIRGVSLANGFLKAFPAYEPKHAKDYIQGLDTFTENSFNSLNESLQSLVAVVNLCSAIEKVIQLYTENSDEDLTPSQKTENTLAKTKAGITLFSSGIKFADLYSSQLGNAIARSGRLGKHVNGAAIGQSISKTVGIIGGVCKIANGIIEASMASEPHEQYGAICDITSGVLDVTAKMWPEYALPLAALSLTFTIAAGYFKDGKLFEGMCTLIIGTFVSVLIGTVLKKLKSAAIRALMNTIMTALGSLSASVSAAVSTMLPLLPVVAPILVWIGGEIFSALASEPPEYAQGGFPAKEKAFIAREAGPELVGTLNGRNAVVNNNQIVQSVSRGVSEAFMAVWHNRSSAGLMDVEVYLDGKQLAAVAY